MRWDFEHLHWRIRWHYLQHRAPERRLQFVQVRFDLGTLVVARIWMAWTSSFPHGRVWWDPGFFIFLIQLVGFDPTSNRDLLNSVSITQIEYFAFLDS